MVDLPASAGDAKDISLILGWERSAAVGSDNPFQYPYLENSMEKAWWAAVHELTKS